MTELRTDEEQAEMLKRWWDENGKSTLIAIVLVAAGWLGWNYYQTQQQTTGEAASALYSSLTEKASAAIMSGNEAAQQEAIVLAEQLKSDFGKSTYSQFASLFLARFAADNGDMNSAAAELRALVDSAEAPIKYLATARLADVLVELDDTDAALALVSDVPDPAYAPQYLEARGDALFRKGDRAAARVAYQEALDAAAVLGVDTQLLQRKSDFLIAAEDA
ncbi:MULTISPECIES: tetratricopeptide repeat protein [unclassified Oceanobacter]|jgi:predicted negative regulator of RcsB-dependent stress response|uniref:YfgM family protein n=2 Tax=Gammaproteobacteria TaxID=1236 RepID=UPI0027359D89|nr:MULTISPECIES: tetratricopeptide repeat protein [unclassified Oceanobacter]MDP2506771.1 tetratricopeptide repeat protein [Oceanobacter sp. 3_MG-2023]MDP2547920.1 tetratricopeptide repeat protein [Oceanobacter sp. 4_MG-2023]MDP2608788.1 tetratricopeptide repeat protein [Oceanobacter sp. 1_MG-2023]MDP2611970.1 tetratricopeptide repeat protein [Oceanobacter sp. 2_MG-2023]